MVLKVIQIYFLHLRVLNEGNWIYKRSLRGEQYFILTFFTFLFVIVLEQYFVTIVRNCLNKITIWQ